MLSLSKQQFEAARARVFRSTRSKVRFDATLREEGGFRFGSTGQSGRPFRRRRPHAAPYFHAEFTAGPVVLQRLYAALRNKARKLRGGAASTLHTATVAAPARRLP
ncbi:MULTISPECIES: hypothetical protein [unclassified Novosphingobium]|uniref:hypothetical protein n=1 Tax=unclassified Novosphingobium TaxID=2644732 RepID=UPI0025E344F9|nr:MULTISPECIES: hypothetical protein [unclassified Novosphingobium]HQV03136.1 hypothetical protein [Novosphingobium sp.]